MKTDFLKELGLEQEVISKIMAENGKDIEAEKAKTTAKVGELNTANQTIKDLKESVSKFDGVDVVKLKKDVSDWETKYNTDIATERAKAENLQKEYGLKDALKASGVVDPEYLIFKHGGVEKFAFGADGKPIGLDDITKPYKESNPHLFAVETPPVQTRTGMRQTGAEMVNDKKDEANAAFRSLFGKE
ncbi:phage scaffolding protein [Anaerovorax odorimutans]|uniref:phage scaffolding protein n=1 Tax=Anaerovorax odorimutans TaxID=109327 RepID=UPI0004231449|nr:phage scaffolding protein [Anaerovorax odorimutans]